MKNFGVTLLVIVLGVTTYLIFESQIEHSKIILFAIIGITIGVVFILHTRITSVKIFDLEINTEIEKALSNAKEIEEILVNIKSQKDMIDLITRDANTAHKQIAQIESIANDANVKAKEIEKILKKAKEEEATKRLRRLSATGREH